MIKLLMSVSVTLLLMQNFGNTSQPRDLRLRLIYLENGKPAKNQQVILYEGNPSQAVTIRISKFTGQDGAAQFHFIGQPPEKLWFGIDNGKIDGCASQEQIDWQKIVKSGVTIGKDARFGAECKGTQEMIDRLGAKPGEVVIFVRKLSAWDNLRHY